MNPIVANSHFYSFERKKSHKSFEKVEKRDEMEIKESPNLFDHHAIFIQKYVEFSNPVYFMVIDKNRFAIDINGDVRDEMVLKSILNGKKVDTTKSYDNKTKELLIYDI